MDTTDPEAAQGCCAPRRVSAEQAPAAQLAYWAPGNNRQGAGRCRCAPAGLGGADRIDGGDGNDTASYATVPAGITQGVRVDLSKVGVDQDTGGAGTDRLEGIANLIGSPFADELSGSQVDNRLEVRDGTGDRVSCSAGADTVVADVEGTDAIAAECEAVQLDFRPDTQIDAGPPSLANDATRSFRFSATKPGSTFECSLDGGAFADCSSTHTPVTAHRPRRQPLEAR